jgi:hypothetical protein
MFNQTPSLNPVNFFALACDCRYLAKKEKTPSFSQDTLPSTHRLTQEHSFSKVAMGWHEEGLGFQVQVDQPFTRAVYPDFKRADSIELFIDTRDLKSAGFNTRFCHHFFFLPQPVEGVSCGEITHFRTEDSHSLCDPQLLVSQTNATKNDYKIKIFIPSQCLHGYDPKQFDRLGFTYRINRVGGKPQHFSVVSQDYPIDQQPSLWASLKLVK